MSGKDITIGHEPDRDRLRSRIAELEGKIRAMDAEAVQCSHRESVLYTRVEGMKKAINEAIEALDDTNRDEVSVTMATDALYSALRRYGA